MLIFCIGVALIGLVRSAVIPEQKCRLDDSGCMTKEFQNALPTFMEGLPEYGVEVLDVMNMDDVKFDLAGLKFSLKEGQLKGLKRSVIDSVKWDLDKKKLHIDYHVNCTVKGHYTAGGRILILPISGDGQMKLKLTTLHIKLSLSYEVEKDADGKDHIVPKKYDFDFEVIDNAHFHLGNLFNGNKQLSEAMHTFLNDNWKQISQEFGKPMMEVAARKIFKNVVAYFGKVPIGDITLDS